MVSNFISLKLFWRCIDWYQTFTFTFLKLFWDVSDVKLACMYLVSNFQKNRISSIMKYPFRAPKIIIAYSHIIYHNSSVPMWWLPLYFAADYYWSWKQIVHNYVTLAEIILNGIIFIISAGSYKFTLVYIYVNNLCREAILCTQKSSHWTKNFNSNPRWCVA